jgi:hypothetical protein
VEPCQPGCHPGKREPSRFETIPSAPLFRDGSGGRARSLAAVFRFQLGLAFVLARIVVLALTACFTWGSNLDGIGPFLAGTLIRRPSSQRRVAKRSFPETPAAAARAISVAFSSDGVDGIWLSAIELRASVRHQASMSTYPRFAVWNGKPRPRYPGLHAFAAGLFRRTTAQSNWRCCYALPAVW